MLNKWLNTKRAVAFVVVTVACLQCNNTAPQKRDKKAILKYLSALPQNSSARVISGQFESWGSAVKPLDDKENCLTIVHQKTGKWVGLVGAEYHNGQEVNYKLPNRLFEEYWDQGGFCQLYLIMTNPSQPASFNGGG